MTEPEVNPIHKKPLWGLYRMEEEKANAFSEADKEWLFSDAELIAIRYALDTVDKQLSIAMPALLTGYSKLIDHLDSELEGGYNKQQDEPTEGSDE